LVTALLLRLAVHAQGQTLVNGSAMPFQSFQSFAAAGSDSGNNATLTQNGYLGTYVNLAQPGPVTFTVNASGVASNGIDPDMTISIADYSHSFDVNSSTMHSYTYTTPTLPAGLYFVRSQLDNSSTQVVGGSAVSVKPTLTVGNLSVSSNPTVNATLNNTASDANALSAANNYINNFRQGTAAISTGFHSGTSVQVSMLRNAFNFGGTVSGVTVGDSKDMLYAPNFAADPEEGQFQSFINSYFNTIVPSNGGKWASNVSGSNLSSLTMQLVDEQLAYAKAHNMQARMHNLIWGSGATSGSQQPSTVDTLLGTATGGGAGATSAKQSLTTDITNRIGYYLSGVSSSSTGSGSSLKTYGTGDIRATDFSQIDVLNEALNSPSYWNIFPNGQPAPGINTIDTIYHQVAQAAAAAGNPNLKLFTNEFNVLQFSPQSISTSGTETGSDPYANWYRNEVEAINNGGVTDFQSKVVNEIGMEMYSNVTGSNQPSANTMQKALQNLSVEGLSLSMNEFGMGSGTSSTDAQSATKGVKALSDSVTMFYGNPLADTFMVWGWWDTAASIAMNGAPPAQFIATSTSGGGYTLTPLGQEWVNLMNAFTTPTQPVIVKPDGTIQFNGFYGEYALKIGSQTYATVDFEKGPNDTPLETLWIKGDFNLDGKLTNADLQAMLNALKNQNSYQAANGMSNEEFNAICDINGDNVFNASDISTMMQLLTSGIEAGVGSGGSSLATVPEPAGIVLVAIALGCLLVRSKLKPVQ
jgi:GH35 family endo-1,4-beta-xylanase